MRLATTIFIIALFAGCTTPASQPTMEEPPRHPLRASNFTWSPGFPSVGEDVQFDPRIKSSAPGDELLGILWDLEQTRSTQHHPTHTFSAAGEHAVRMTVMTKHGGHHVVERVVTVLPGSPEPEPDPGPDAEPEPGPDAPEPDPSSQGLPQDAHPTIVALLQEISRAGPDEPVRLPAVTVDGFLGFDDWGPSRDFDVLLAESPVLSADAFAEIDSQAIPRPFIEVYEGHVLDNVDHLVRLTVTPYWARGSIRTIDDVHLIRINFDGNHPILPGGHSSPEGPGTEPNSAEPVNCPGGVSSWAPSMALASPLPEDGRSTWAPITARIIVDGDGRLAQQLGFDAFGTLVAMAAEVDAIYDHEVGVRLEVTGIHLHTDPAFYPDPEQQAPLDQMGRYWDTYHTDDRDMVHLVTGFDSSFAQANCIGAAGHTAGYTFTPYPWELRYPVFQTNAFAHELGHIFSAHHHYGNHAEADLATVMIQGYTPGVQGAFSSLSRMVIRGWAETHLE